MSMMFEANLKWLPAGEPFVYKSYSRQYLVKSAGKPDFIGTAAPAYFGSHYHYNPEDLLVVSVSACHMLSFLALAANAKVEILSYEDAPSGELFQDDKKITRFKEIVLRPQAKLADPSQTEKVKALHDKAHHICFIANSVNFPVRVSV